MEALEFIKQKDRMCGYYCGEVCTHDDSGETCPARRIDCEITTDEPERLVAIVEKWAKEHPVKPEQGTAGTGVPSNKIPEVNVTLLRAIHIGEEAIISKEDSNAKMD